MQCRGDNDAALFDLDRMAAYHFGQAGPGQAAGLGRPAQIRRLDSTLFLVNLLTFLLIPSSFKNS
jgi:hypothetical protein